ncbi:MAG: hypothetical protein EKK64_06930 [Neisseriaceae bacterium]|nr:MAG: hypothetical protein EKK64_06930 [Neisseriaceae bacterium]
MSVIVDNACYEMNDGVLYLNIFENNSIYPSVIYPNKTKEWHLFSQSGNPLMSMLNRSNDLPAIEYSNGDKEWWYYGTRHRVTGPAVIYGNKHYWFKDGNFIKMEINNGL